MVIYIFTRDITYLYYIAYVSSFLTWHYVFAGIFPFDTFSSTASFYFFTLFIPLSIAFLVIFSRTILNTKATFTKIDFILKSIAYFYIFLSFLALVNIEFVMFLTNSAATLTFPFLLFVGFKSYFAGNKIAIVYIIAQLLFLFLISIFSLATNGFLEYSLFTRHGLIVGFIIENILFSLALAYRIRLLREDKIDLMSNANKKLEMKVQERTNELQVMVTQRELLFKELYHRVKNNFQMIVSLLWLEADKQENLNQDNLVLTTMISRIKAMASVNNMLYNSNDISTIQSDEYLLSIVEETQRVYTQNEVLINHNIDRCSLTIDHAMLLGMIMNEVLVNAIKHHKEENICIVDASFLVNENKVVLNIKDNGKNFLEDKDKTDGLGLNLIKQFSKKLPNSTVKYSYDKGTLFQLEFTII